MPSLKHSGKVAMKISDELKFKVWGFSTSRVALTLDVINIAFCVGCLALEANYFHYSIGNDCGPVASMLFLNALILCFLPPYDNFKLLVCWPVTGFTLIPMILLPSLK